MHTRMGPYDNTITQHFQRCIYKDINKLTSSGVHLCMPPPPPPGYSVRTYTHRYTRWVNVSADGSPSWWNVIGEELYLEETANGSDDFDTSELVNLAHSPVSPDNAALLKQMRKLLTEGFVANESTF